jgi:Domain of unknown function (DUF6471)
MEWTKAARQILRAEIVHQGLSYKVLAGRLRDIGVEETERSIINKLSRGTFSFVFALQCLHVMGVDLLRVGAPGRRPNDPSP